MNISILFKQKQKLFEHQGFQIFVYNNLFIKLKVDVKGKINNKNNKIIYKTAYKI